MKNLDRIQELETLVQNAETSSADGRQKVANSCKELYNLIEDDLYNKFGEAAINDAYTDLCNGNFAEPFMCQKKKEKFALYTAIYVNNVV